jgi:hypothetical protein
VESLHVERGDAPRQTQLPRNLSDGIQLGPRNVGERVEEDVVYRRYEVNDELGAISSMIQAHNVLRMASLFWFLPRCRLKMQWSGHKAVELANPQWHP